MKIITATKNTTEFVSRAALRTHATPKWSSRKVAIVAASQTQNIEASKSLCDVLQMQHSQWAPATVQIYLLNAYTITSDNISYRKFFDSNKKKHEDREASAQTKHVFRSIWHCIPFVHSARFVFICNTRAFSIHYSSYEICSRKMYNCAHREISATEHSIHGEMW